MNQTRELLWYGRPPLPGTRSRLEERGYRIERMLGEQSFPKGRLGQVFAVIFDHSVDGLNKPLSGYELIKDFINHGLPIFIVCSQPERSAVTSRFLSPHGSAYPWEEVVQFLPDFKGSNFDVFVKLERGAPWTNTAIDLTGHGEGLTEEEEILLARAFQNARQIKLSQITPGFTQSRVFMVHEEKKRNSFAHLAQPRLVKIGPREKVLEEVKAMKEVSPFIPFELRPNFEVSVRGFSKALYVADFVDKSEPLLEVAHDGRAEAALSNLFYRTLRVWRECAWGRPLSTDSLADAAERLGMLLIHKIKPEYLESESFAKLRIEPKELWEKVKTIKFPHRVATIHGDLHGNNVRVRGDDAIVIDLGEVQGTDSDGAPVCFDVAMLDVALSFQCLDERQSGGDFDQPAWEDEVSKYYNLESLQSASHFKGTNLGSWLHGCLQRIRAFGTYEQSDPLEYPIAVAIAMWRWCKFDSSGPGDKGRRVVALILGAQILQEAIRSFDARTRGHA